MKLFLKIMVVAVLLTAVLKSCSPFSQETHPLTGQPAVDFTLSTLSGQEQNMAAYRNGRPAIIFFWATWCPHCRTQLKELAQQRSDIEGKGIKLILVDVGESLQEVKDYVQAQGISSDVFLDEASQVAEEYRIVGVPTFFFVDQDGMVTDVRNYLPQGYQEILLGLGS
jgi:peroxiredoxin